MSSSHRGIKRFNLLANFVCSIIAFDLRLKCVATATERARFNFTGDYRSFQMRLPNTFPLFPENRQYIP